MKAAINALTMALLEAWPLGAQDDGITIREAKDFAEAFFTENADLFMAPALTQRKGVPLGGDPMSPYTVVEDEPVEGGERARVLYRPAAGQDGLTDKQRAAVGKVGLCSNCQQPNNDHLPGCAKRSGEDPNAVTKNALPPAV